MSIFKLCLTADFPFLEEMGNLQKTMGICKKVLIT